MATEIAFDISSAERALDAVKRRPAFGFNYDPSHFGYQGVDYVALIERFGGHLDFGHRDRYWDFRSIGRGKSTSRRSSAP